MSRWTVFLTVAAAAAALAAGPAAGQAYNRECEIDRIRQHADFKKRVGALDPARHGALIEGSRQAQEFVKKGEELNERYTQTVTPISARRWRDITRSRAYRRDAENLRRMTRNVDLRKQRSVRKYQRARTKFDRRYRTEHLKGLVKHPVVDGQNAGGNRFQNASNVHEQIYLAQQLAADVGTEERQKIVAATVERFSRDMGFNPANVERLKNSETWGKAVTALGVIGSFADSATIDENQAYGVPKGFWDGDAGVAIGGATAADMTGWMNLNHTTSNWGGTRDMPAVRGDMGPKTRASVAELGGRGISNIDRGGMVRQRLKKAFRDHGLLPAKGTPRKPRPVGKIEQLPIQEQAQKILKKEGISGLMSTISDAVKEGREKVAPLRHIFVSDDSSGPGG